MNCGTWREIQAEEGHKFSRANKKLIKDAVRDCLRAEHRTLPYSGKEKKEIRERIEKAVVQIEAEGAFPFAEGILIKAEGTNSAYHGNKGYISIGSRYVAAAACPEKFLKGDDKEERIDEWLNMVVAHEYSHSLCPSENVDSLNYMRSALRGNGFAEGIRDARTASYLSETFADVNGCAVVFGDDKEKAERAMKTAERLSTVSEQSGIFRNFFPGGAKDALSHPSRRHRTEAVRYAYSHGGPVLTGGLAAHIGKLAGGYAVTEECFNESFAQYNRFYKEKGIGAGLPGSREEAVSMAANVNGARLFSSKGEGMKTLNEGLKGRGFAQKRSARDIYNENRDKEQAAERVIAAINFIEDPAMHPEAEGDRIRAGTILKDSSRHPGGNHFLPFFMTIKEGTIDLVAFPENHGVTQNEANDICRFITGHEHAHMDYKPGRLETAAWILSDLAASIPGLKKLYGQFTADATFRDWMDECYADITGNRLVFGDDVERSARTMENMIKTGSESSMKDDISHPGRFKRQEAVRLSSLSPNGPFTMSDDVVRYITQQVRERCGKYPEEKTFRKIVERYNECGEKRYGRDFVKAGITLKEIKEGRKTHQERPEHISVQEQSFHKEKAKEAAPCRTWRPCEHAPEKIRAEARSRGNAR